MRKHHNIAEILKALLFPVYLISGEARYGGGTLRLLYGGGNPVRAYLTSLAISGPATSIFLGKKTHFGFARCARKIRPDLEFIRSHTLLASGTAFSNRLFLPDWVSGHADLLQQANHEDRSRSRQRDRRLMARHGIDYSVTTDISELNYFYDHMYVPHVSVAHGDAALFMSRERMHRYVQQSGGELLVVRLQNRPVAGSFVVYEKAGPRLFSGGVLNRDRTLLRKGVGTAIYLLSFDHLRSRGYSSVNLGRTRPFLSDGALYFKRRFGLTITDVSCTGLLTPTNARTPAAAQFLKNNGLIHLRKGSLRSAFLSDDSNPEGHDVYSEQMQLAQSLGISEFDRLRCDRDLLLPDQSTSNVNVAHKDS